MEIKIERNIPIPKYDRLGKWESLLLSMKIGDSFAVSAKKPLYVIQVVFRAAKRLGLKAVSRRLKAGGYRIWRTQ